MKATKHYSHVGKRTNEDGYIFTDDYVVFLDGATGLSKRLVDPISDAKWYVNQFISIFQNKFRKNENPRSIIKETIREIKERYMAIVGDIEIKNHMLPSATGTIVIFNSIMTDIYYFGDIKTLVLHNDESIESINDRSLTNLDNKIFRTARKNSKINETSFKHELNQLKKEIKANRDKMNKKNGYYIFSLDDSVIDHINCKKVSTTSTKEILLMTDGFYGYYERYSYKRIFEFVHKYDPKEHVLKIKRFYRADKDYERRNRFKLVDDISFLLIENKKTPW